LPSRPPTIARPRPQNYVRQRIRSFAQLLAPRLGTGISAEDVDALVRETIALLPPVADNTQAPANLRLVLRHDCQ
jgi:hypothetical protein